MNVFNATQPTPIRRSMPQVYARHETASVWTTVYPAVVLTIAAAGAIIAAIFVNLTVAFGTLLVLLCSYWLISINVDCRRITIVSFWYITYIAGIFFPAFVVFGDQAGPYRVGYMWAVESVLITVPIGIALASAVLRFRRAETEAFFQRPMDSRTVPSVLVFGGLLFISLALTAKYVTEVHTIPMFYLLKHPGAFRDLIELREDALKLLDSPFRYPYYILRQLFYPFLIVVGFGAYWLTRQTRWRVLFGLAFIAGIFYNSLMIAKAPVAELFAILAFFIYLYRGGRLTAVGAVLAFVLVLAFPVAILMGLWYGSNNNIWDPLVAIGHRLFYVPAENLYFYFEIFPAKVAFLHGRSISSVATVMGWHPFDTHNFVGNYGFKMGLKSVSANATFIGDMNADFGPVGVVLGGIATGFILQAIHIFLIRQRKTVIAVGCYAFLVFTFWQLNATALPIVLASDGAIFSLILYYWFELSSSPMGEAARLSALGKAQDWRRTVRYPFRVPQ